MIKENPTYVETSAGSRVSKYLLYAIGEIVLVVIGILIALSINNWNENRKLHKTINNVYSIIKGDLLADIKGIDKIVGSMESTDTIFKRVISNTMKYYDI